MNINSFIVSNKQIELDSILIPYDLWATKVHVLMLGKQKITNTSRTKKILSTLLEIEKEYKQEKFSIDPNKGLHLTIEAKVIEKIGDAGYFMHTARSRNDQVMTCELLYLRETALNILEELVTVQKELVYFASKHIDTIMPGYTHMQPAKPTTFAQWCLAYNDMFGKCFETLKYFYEKYDLCPLGTVESYGTSWNIDREYTAKLLGFTKVWEIPQEAISSRGFTQLAYLGGLKDIAIVESKIVSDLLLFTTFEFGYINLSDKIAARMGIVTGSSIMPQKKNPDVLELLRSIAPQIIGYESIVANILSGLPMGYNRDTREVKEYIELGFSKVQNTLVCLKNVLNNMIVKKDKMLKSVLENYSLATDLTDYISQKTGLPYRKVYQLVGFIVKEKIKQGEAITSFTVNELLKTAYKLNLKIEITDEELKMVMNPINVIAKRIHTGGTAPAVMKKMISKRKKLIISHGSWLVKQMQKIDLAKAQTKKEISNLLEAG